MSSLTETSIIDEVFILKLSITSQNFPRIDTRFDIFHTWFPIKNIHEIQRIFNVKKPIQCTFRDILDPKLLSSL